MAQFKQSQVQEASRGAVQPVTSVRWRAICNQTAQRWRARHQHDTVICPLKTDYCDRCKEYYEQINMAQTTANRVHESRRADPDILAGHKCMAVSYRHGTKWPYKRGHKWASKGGYENRHLSVTIDFKRATAGCAIAAAFLHGSDLLRSALAACEFR